MSGKFPGGFVTTGAPAGFSVAFDGTGDYLTWSGSTVGAGVFTFECWFYANNFSASQSLFGPNGTTNGGFGFNVASSTSISIDRYGVSADNFTVPTMSTNTWYHIAVVRNASNATTVFLNGVRSSTGTTTIAYTFGNVGAIGYTSSAVNRYFNGYISNARYVAAAVYDPTATTINVPTQLFPITSTVLLACQSPTIIDNSTNAFTITVNGNAAVSNFTPFAGYTAGASGFNPALGAAAGGVWTLDEAAYYQQNRIWPIYDPYFNRTTLMLHGNGTNGAQNNTFLDSSTNNFTITRNPTSGPNAPTQGTFSPFSQTGWSTFFNGSTDYLLGGTSSAYTFGTGDLTIELWMWATTTTGGQGLIGFGGAVSGVATLFINAASGTANIRFNASSGTSVDTPNNAWSPNQWNHIAVSRASGTTRIFVNGVLQVSASQTDNLGGADISIGRAYYNLNQEYFSGYLSNIRIIKGTALYTSNFTPSTQPLNVVTNTVLLTCQDNRFVDDSANNFTITTGGTPSVQAFSPFVPAYITPTTYSNYFDGNGDYLRVSSGACVAFGTSDFTIECFVYFNNTTANQIIIDARPAATGNYPFLYLGASTTLNFNVNGSNVLAYASIVAGTWYHIAIARNGTNLRLFINGVQSGSTATNSANFVSPGANYPFIGSNYVPGDYLNGVISNLRIVNGTALYTAAFTPPTAPLTNITNTSLLTCQSSTFIDNSTNNFTITATGNVKPVTSPTPFPAKVDTTTLNSAYSTSLIGGSGYFDGTGDYLSTTYNANLLLNGVDCTVEGWFYLLAAPGAVGASIPFITQGIGAYGNNPNDANWELFSDATSLVWGKYPTFASVSASNVPVRQWFHLAATMTSANTGAIFVNGVRLVSTASLTAIGSSTSYNTNVGGFFLTGGGAGTQNYMNGYASGVRITKGSILYTSSFALPITPPTPVTNTQLLLNFTNAGIIDNTAKNVLETVGNAQISTTQSKWGGSSMYFDGTGDWLKFPTGSISASNYDFGSGDFTIEAWIYMTSIPSNSYEHIVSFGVSGSAQRWSFYIETRTVASAPYLAFASFNSANTAVVSVNGAGSSGWSANTWYHVAVTRNGSTFKLFRDGIQNGATVTDTDLVPGTAAGTTSYLTVGTELNLTTPTFVGYIDDLRITKGVARYTTNFTPPTSQLQDQ